jgi:formamidopyrimidine-DNA glycosylase
VFFNGDPLAYKSMLTGRKIISAKGLGIFVDIYFDKDITLSICDGIKPQYGIGATSIPQKYQLLLTFDDETLLAFNVAMYGGLFAYQGSLENIYHEKSFTLDYFENNINEEKKKMPVRFHRKGFVRHA